MRKRERALSLSPLFFLNSPLCFALFCSLLLLSCLWCMDKKKEKNQEKFTAQNVHCC